MPYSSYTSLSTLSLGETSFTLEKYRVTSSYIDFILRVFGSKWQDIDVAFEYRLNEYDQWRTDASIIGSQSSYIQGNKLLGLLSSDQGTANRFRWKFIDNDITEGMTVELRVRLLPRTQNYSYFNGTTIVSEAYGESFFDLVGSTNRKCIGRDLYGRYICLDNTSVSVYESLSSESPLYTFGGLNNPVFAKQIRDGGYIVAEYGNNTVFELDETMSNVTKTVSTINPVYFDYSEQNETLIISCDGSSNIYEVTWSEMDYGTVLWTSSNAFSDVQSAVYNRNNFDEVVVTDTTQVYLLDRASNTYSTYTGYRFESSTREESYKGFWEPYRAFFYDDDTICVIEKDGEVLDFDTLYTSSSSSIDSSSSSSSSSNSSSSSSSS